MKEKLLHQAEHEYSPRQRIIGLFFEGLFFLGVLPLLLIGSSTRLDQAWGWPTFTYPPVNLIVSGLMIIAGILFALWSIYVQFTTGRGTPVPVMATQELIISPPYNYCRNPMALGTIVMYLGLAVGLGSYAAVLLVLVGAVLLLTYIKLFEEKEMEWRFGEAYETYRQQTPFIIPRWGLNKTDHHKEQAS